MNLQDLMGRVVDELYAGLTGGSAELPLPSRTIINWILPGIPLHESFFDFAIAGPFSGPSPATLADFEALAKAIAGEEEAGGAPMDRALVIEEAKRMYQQHLLGSWEQWSRLVDFVPLVNRNMEWTSKEDQGSQKHVGIVYAQAGQTLSQVYKDTLERCLVAEEKLTEQQEKIIERMKALLQVTVKKEDFLTGEEVEEIVDSPALTLYNEKKLVYENAVIDYASRLARANAGSAADLIEWSQTGGLFKRRALEALRDWQATGNREAIETAQSTIAHITGGNMVSWKQALLDSITAVEDNTTGVFGNSFFPATVLPGAFARSSGWTRYNQRNLNQTIKQSSSSHSGSMNFSLFSFGASGGASRKTEDFKLERDEFGLEFEYTQVEICRPAFNPNFFMSRGWKPKDSFIDLYDTDVHSTGGDNPEGAFIGYPTKALFVRNLRFYSSELAQFMHSKETEIHGGGGFGIGPFSIGGKYAQTNRKSESNLQIDTAGITVKGMQLVAFVSALFPAAANPNPDVESWI